MIHGVVQDGAILPLDPIPPEWADGRQVLIEAVGEGPRDERAAIEQWYSRMEQLGAAEYGPGEREAIERFMAEADRDAKDAMRRSWARFDDLVPPGHQSSERRDQP